MQPEFKKVDKFVDGQLIEVFYIDDKEVSEQVYYAILESTYDDNNTLGIPNFRQEYDFDAMSEIEKVERQNDWIKRFLHCLKDVSEDEAIDLLAYELAYYYKYGLYTGQIIVNEKYIEGMQLNLNETQKFLDELNR